MSSSDKYGVKLKDTEIVDKAFELREEQKLKAGALSPAKIMPGPITVRIVEKPTYFTEQKKYADFLLQANIQLRIPSVSPAPSCGGKVDAASCVCVLQ
jgi:hypothetical protein